MTRVIPYLAAGLLALGLAGAAFGQAEPAGWSERELATLRGLSIDQLPPLPPDPSNRVADDERAARFGQRLFFDPRLSGNGKVACASCHLPGKQFQDGMPLARGMGTTSRRTMSVVGAAYSPWQFWDGRKDSLWSQALGPLESAVEHGGNRTLYVRLVARHYRAEYESIFGRMPATAALPANAGPLGNAAEQAAWQSMSGDERDAVNRAFANLGKAIAAYERKILPGRSRFDDYVAAALQGDRQRMAATLSEREAAGLRLFIGKAECTQCHNGPLLTNNDFHNTGVPAAPELPPDDGRRSGVQQALADEFNCLGRYSDARPEQCGELRHAVSDGQRLLRQFRPPSLRGVAERAPYMHAGQLPTLARVIEHYNRAPAAPAGHSELKPLRLSAQEISDLAAFLGTLSAPPGAEARWLRPPAR